MITRMCGLFLHSNSIQSFKPLNHLCSLSVNADSGLNAPEIDVSIYARIGQPESIAFPSLSSSGYVYGRDLVPTTAQPPLQLTPVSYPITDSFPPYPLSNVQPSYQSYPVQPTQTQLVTSYMASAPLPISSRAGYPLSGTQSNREHFASPQPTAVDARMNTGRVLISAQVPNGKAWSEALMDMMSFKLTERQSTIREANTFHTFFFHLFHSH